MFFLISERAGKTGKNGVDRFLISSLVPEMSGFKEMFLAKKTKLVTSPRTFACQ